MFKNQHIKTEVRVSPDQFPEVIYITPDDTGIYGGQDDVHIMLEGIINPNEEVSVFTKTHIAMNRTQANQLLTALYLALSGKKVDEDATRDGTQYLQFTRAELEDNNSPIAILERYTYAEEHALAQWDAQKDEASL
jgi:hypothetical protein